MPLLLIVIGIITFLFLMSISNDNTGDGETDFFDESQSPDTIPDNGNTITGQTDMDYKSLAEYYALQQGLDPSLVKAIIQTESSWNPNAISNKGAVGLMQLLPKYFGSARDLKDPETNIKTGTEFLASLLEKYPEDVAIQMYNVGETGYNNGARATDYLAKVKSNQQKFG